MTAAYALRKAGLTACLLVLAGCHGEVDWGNGGLAGAEGVDPDAYVYPALPAPRTDPAGRAGADTPEAQAAPEATPEAVMSASASASAVAVAEQPGPKALPVTAPNGQIESLPELVSRLAAAGSGSETSAGAATGAGSAASGNAEDDLSALRFSDAGVDPDMVRAPELFAASGLAEWNGLRTARGVWVAHPRARGATKVRIVNSQTGAEIDGMLYRPERTSAGDIITVSSDTAAALGLRPDQPTLVALFGLRPKGATSKGERRAVETTAFGELATHVTRMEDNALLQLVAAAMRGMGYATVFEDGPPDTGLPAIRAYPRPDDGFQLPAIRVVVRPNGKAPMSAGELSSVQKWITGSGDLGVIISVPGFRADAERGLDRAAVHLQMVDLDGLLNIWLTHYEQLSEPDRALMPLQPVYFLARG